MFEQALALNSCRTMRPWTVPVIAFAQLAAVTSMLVAPLIWIEPLPRVRLIPEPFRRSFVELVEARPIAGHHPSVVRLPMHRRFTLVAPSSVPRGMPALIEDAVPAVAGATGVPGAPEGIPGYEGLSVPAPTPPARELAPVETPAKQTAPIRVGGNIRPPLLVHDVRPAYPSLARTARISGAVRLDAVITREGAVRSIQVTRGHPLLVPAAVEAVRQWRYQPTLLNGEPVEVALSIEINFSIATP